MDKINAIQSFVEVARCGSFTHAAEQLELSRLQVSRHVQEIEKWLHLRVFHRTTRKVSLTLQGEEALTYCLRILGEIDELENRSLSHNTELQGTIRLTAPIGLGQHLLFDEIEAFSTLHPKVNFQLVLSDSLSQLVDDRVDLAFRYIHQPDEHLIAKKLMQIDCVLCASPNYLTKLTSPLVKPEDLLQHNCLVHSSANYWQLAGKNSLQSIHISGNIKANDMSVILKAALKGMGIALLPCDLANPYLGNQQLVEILANYHVPTQNLWAVYLSRHYQQKAIRSFIDFIAARWSADILKRN